MSVFALPPSDSFNKYVNTLSRNGICDDDEAADEEEEDDDNEEEDD